MHHLHWKSILFYASIISAAFVLFDWVSRYGEANLKAPMKVSGLYRISGKNFPDCLKSEVLELTIDQSGQYLYGNVSSGSQDAKSSDREPMKIPISGTFKDQTLVLSSQSISCQPSANSSYVLQIQAQPQSDALTGHITWNPGAPKLGFTTKAAVVEAPTKAIEH
jgi:hypothetical protein